MEMTSSGVQVGGRREMPSGALAPQSGPALVLDQLTAFLPQGQEGICHLRHKSSDLCLEHPSSKGPGASRRWGESFFLRKGSRKEKKTPENIGAPRHFFTQQGLVEFLFADTVSYSRLVN